MKKDTFLQKPVCIVVHPLFANSAFTELKDSGVKEIVSTNTVRHLSNKIDVLSNLLLTLD
jgi:ribose-phosphate pyrophosphokinase